MRPSAYLASWTQLQQIFCVHCTAPDRSTKAAGPRPCLFRNLRPCSCQYVEDCRPAIAEVSSFFTPKHAVQTTRRTKAYGTLYSISQLVSSTPAYAQSLPSAVCSGVLFPQPFVRSPWLVSIWGLFQLETRAKPAPALAPASCMACAQHSSLAKSTG